MDGRWKWTMKRHKPRQKFGRTAVDGDAVLGCSKHAGNTFSGDERT